MSKKQQKRDFDPAAGVKDFMKQELERTGQRPPPPTKTVEKTAERVVRDIIGGSSGSPKAPFLTHNEMQAFFKKEITSFAKQFQGQKIPKVVKDYIRCLIMPSEGTAVRIPDGKSRASVIAATYNIFPVKGNYAGGTAGGDLGRFFWSFTPTPLNFIYSVTPRTLVPMYWPTPGAAQATGFSMSEYVQGAFALQIDPSIKWDPNQALIGTPTFLDQSVGEELSDDDPHLSQFSKMPPEIIQHVKKNPRLRNHSTSAITLHYECELVILKTRLLVSNPKLSQKERDSAILKYAEAKRSQQRIMASPNTDAGYIYYQDGDAPFLTGTGSTTYNNTTDGTVEYQQGVARSVRAVAQSIWFECTATDFVDGGSVSITYLPADSLIGNVIPYNPGSAGSQTWGKGPLQNWENHAKLPLQNSGSNRGPATTYVGKFKEGAFAYWTPESDVDFNFLPVVQHAATPMPMILVAGQNGGGTAGQVDPGMFANIHVHTVYEYQTDEPDVDAEASPQVPGGLDWVAGVMRQFPQAMSNDSHVKWWQYVLRAIGAGTIGFLTGGPAGAAIGVGGVLAATELGGK